MYLLNLSLAQFFALLGAVSALVMMLYLLDRSRRRQTVSTLRFWVAAEDPPPVRRRKRIQQPWSLLLQLTSMALLLLSIAQLRWGAEAGKPRDHVLILDTSAWMKETRNATDGKRTLMDEARDRALAYLKTVPVNDRVMLVRADALATPATAFESSRLKVENAITGSRPSSTALDLEQALHFARHVQTLGSRRDGEIVYVGAGRVAGPATGASPGNLRVLPVRDDVENCGIRRIGVRRSTLEPNVWDILVAARNYGTRAKLVTVAIAFGGSPAGSRQLTLPPGTEHEVSFQWRTRAAGLLEARLTPGDAFPDDDHAAIELPAQENLAVTVYSDEPELLRPMLAANPRVSAVFRGTAQYTDTDHGLVVLDRFRPEKRPRAHSVWIVPPVVGSPVPVRMTAENIPLTRWCTDNPLCEGLRTRDLRLSSTRVFEAAPDDLKIAEVEGGPVIVARQSRPKLVVIGFDPALSDTRYALATPLLFANILRWVAPDIFRRPVLSAVSVGTVNVEMDSDPRPSDIRVLREDGTALPFTVRDRTVRFFSGAPGAVRIVSADREMVYSLTLPQLWESKWEIPAGAKRGMPVFTSTHTGSHELWPWFAVLGALGLFAEWTLFGRVGRTRVAQAIRLRSLAGVR